MEIKTITFIYKKTAKKIHRIKTDSGIYQATKKCDHQACDHQAIDLSFNYNNQHYKLFAKKVKY
jgi:hypothetical protein